MRVDDAMTSQNTVYFNEIVYELLAMRQLITKCKCPIYVNLNLTCYIQTIKYVFILLRQNNYVYNYNTNKINEIDT